MNKNRAYLIILNCLLLMTIKSANALEKSEIDSLRSQIIKLTSTKKAEIGVAVYCLETHDTLTVGNAKHYPMQSVYKFHLALAILNEVDKGTLSLDQKVFISKKDLNSNTWSPLQKKYPNGNIKLKLSEIIIYAISMSDNNCCDILFKIIGGVKKVNDYIQSIGIQDISIKATENDMHKSWDVQFTNWTTPFATVALLEKFYNQHILSKNSFDFLYNAMINSSNSIFRIKGKLPKETIVAHKTGTSGTNEEGIEAAVNDVGIITLPNGQHIALAIYITNSKEEFEIEERIIAEIAKMTWDTFIK